MFEPGEKMVLLGAGGRLFDVLKTFPIPSRRIFVDDGNLYHQIHITQAVGPT